MAKWGEGDERWKVNDLGESGRNVNSWHWEESDVLPWCKKRLGELFGNEMVLVDDDGVRVVCDGKVTVKGDAIINRRKGKVIPAYELDVCVGWKGVGVDGESWSGEVKAPYISEENHDEDPEVQVTVKEKGAEAEMVRGVVVKKGRGVVYRVFGEFVKELRAGGPNKSSMVLNDGKKTEEMQSSKSEEDVVKMVSTSSKKIGKQSLEIVEHYYASSKDIYECFTNEAKVKAFTGSSADIKAEEKGNISMFGGSIVGVFTKLEPYSLLEMDWRFSSWPDGAMSKVKVMLEEKEKGSVVLTLTQEGIPDTDRFGNHDVVNMTKSGWKQQVLNRMKQVFGYGL